MINFQGLAPVFPLYIFSEYLFLCVKKPKKTHKQLKILRLYVLKRYTYLEKSTVIVPLQILKTLKHLRHLGNWTKLGYLRHLMHLSNWTLKAIGRLVIWSLGHFRCLQRLKALDLADSDQIPTFSFLVQCMILNP